MTRIREHFLFDIYIENDFLIINNTHYAKDNGKFGLESILTTELIRKLSFWNRILEVTLGLAVPAKSYFLRINFENNFKDIVVPNDLVKKTEVLIYEINQFLFDKKKARRSKKIQQANLHKKWIFSFKNRTS